jgi:hypothetical protein
MEQSGTVKVALVCESPRKQSMPHHLSSSVNGGSRKEPVDLALLQIRDVPPLGGCDIVASPESNQLSCGRESDIFNHCQHRHVAFTRELELLPFLVAVWTVKRLFNLSCYWIHCCRPKRDILVTASGYAPLRYDWLTCVLAPCADLPCGFLNSDKAFAAVNIRPDGIESWPGCRSTA